MTYISWAPHCSRSDHTARELGGTSHMVYWGWLGSRLATVWLKYLGQTLETWKVLCSERPDVAFVMTPPPIAIIPVYLYCTLRRIPFVVDAHSGVFLTNRWRFFQGLQFWLCRRAATTIVTNEHLAGLVRSHAGHAVVVPDVPVEFNDTASPPADVDGFTVVFVTSFDRDEPIGAMIEAARRLPDVQFRMTGDPGRAIVPQLLPPNLRFTGFLQTDTYGALLRHAGVVVALTTDDFTMQRAAYEGIFQGTPVIVSDTELLRSSFDEGAVHVDNTPDAIVRAVLRVRGSSVEYRQAALRLGARKRERWRQAQSELLATLDGTWSPGTRGTPCGDR